MKIPFSLVLMVCATAFFSCKKNNSPSGNNPPPPAATDTLMAGWSKKIVDSPGVFSDIFFINNTGFAITDSSIYKSTNGGNDWTRIVSQGADYVNIGMGSETNVAIATGPNKIVSSGDGGMSFNTVAVSDFGITDVFYVGPGTAYAAGTGIWKTTDSGSHWNKLYDFPSAGAYKSLYFLDEQTGWVIRGDGLYKTTNGGVNWQPVNTGPQFNFATTCDVVFVDSSHGFVADALSVGATTDGGANWNKIYSGSNMYHDLFFLDDNTGYMTDEHYILKTTNGGASWTKVAIVPGATFYELHFTDANHGWACGSGGTILKFSQP